MMYSSGRIKKPTRVDWMLPSVPETPATDINKINTKQDLKSQRRTGVTLPIKKPP